MKAIEPIFSSVLLLSAVALGFGAAFVMADLWLRAMVGSITKNTYGRNTYNVTKNVPENSAAPLP